MPDWECASTIARESPSCSPRLRCFDRRKMRDVYLEDVDGSVRDFVDELTSQTFHSKEMEGIAA